MCHSTISPIKASHNQRAVSNVAFRLRDEAKPGQKIDRQKREDEVLARYGRNSELRDREGWLLAPTLCCRLNFVSTLHRSAREDTTFYLTGR
jgi:hypothetical protein